MFVIGNKNSDIHDYIFASFFSIIYFFSTYFIQNNIILAEKTYKSVCENWKSPGRFDNLSYLSGPMFPSLFSSNLHKIK